MKKSDFIRSRGMRFPKDGRIIQGRIRGALRQESYERKEADAALRNVRAGDVVMELGAGIGFMSTLVATQCKVAHVHAFEANPHLLPYIRNLHAANGVENVTLHNAILGQGSGSVDFFVRQNLLASSMSPIEDSTVLTTEHVEVRDARTAMAEIAPNVLICDIEGAEVDVIPMFDLATLRAAIVELHPQWIGPEGVNTVFQAFMDAGMAYYARGSLGKVVVFRRDWHVT